MKKKIIVTLIAILILGFVINQNSSYTKEDLYINQNNYESNLKNPIGVYIQQESGDYVYSTSIPGKDDGYTLNTSKSMCAGNSTVSWDKSTWSAVISNIENNNTKCYLYFDIDTYYAREYILSQNTINNSTPTFSNAATTNEGMFKTEDDDGTSYYYRGAVTNNYFYFGGYYWRIIRINGDGTVRLIYQGNSSTDNGQIGTSAFNSTYNDNMYVGYMYTSGSVHGTETSSTIKGSLDNWYIDNLKEYENYIDGAAGFCGDRTPSTSESSSNGSGGTGTTETYYGAFIRLITNKSPDLKCTNKNDLYTTNNSGKGNKTLTYPIGLITADELTYAGALYNTTNTSFYLYTGNWYWTMTPGMYYSSQTSASIFRLNSSGTISDSYAHNTFGIRPVINIRKNVELTGTGTSTDPFRLINEELITAKDTILANKTINQRTDFTTALTANTTGTMYKAEDDDGDSYYYAGAPTDNWVKFAGFYWRIIRINGDGTIRLIYNGTSTSTTGEGTQDGYRSFNLSNDNNMYVGYMYTSGSVHGTGTSSTIKGALESWYESNLTNYKSYIDPNAGFCNDRSSYTDLNGTTSGGGTGTTNTYYGPYVRLYYQLYNQKLSTASPTLKCTSSADLHTSTDSNKGNKALTYPIGLITADEVVYGGAYFGYNNTSYYLNTGQYYWTMSPGYYDNGGAYAIAVTSNGYFDKWSVTNSIGVRPVINLRADVTLTGSGSSTDPYQVEA